MDIDYKKELLKNLRSDKKKYLKSKRVFAKLSEKIQSYMISKTINLIKLERIIINFDENKLNFHHYLTVLSFYVKKVYIPQKERVYFEKNFEYIVCYLLYDFLKRDEVYLNKKEMYNNKIQLIFGFKKDISKTPEERLKLVCDNFFLRYAPEAKEDSYIKLYNLLKEVNVYKKEFNNVISKKNERFFLKFPFVNLYFENDKPVFEIKNLKGFKINETNNKIDYINFKANNFFKKNDIKNRMVLNDNTLDISKYKLTTNNKDVNIFPLKINSHEIISNENPDYLKSKRNSYKKKYYDISFYNCNFYFSVKEVCEYLGLSCENKKLLSKVSSLIENKNTYYVSKKNKYFLDKRVQNLFNKEIISIMASVLYGSNTCETYNYFNANNNLDIRKKRVQAVKSYPLLANILLNDKSALKIIEEEARLENYIREVYQLPRYIIKNICRQHSQKTGRYIKHILMSYVESKMKNKDLHFKEKSLFLINKSNFENANKNKFKLLEKKIQSVELMFNYFQGIPNETEVSEYFINRKSNYPIVFQEFCSFITDNILRYFNIEDLYTINNKFASMLFIGNHVEGLEKRYKKWENEAQHFTNEINMIMFNDKKNINYEDLNTKEYWAKIIEDYDDIYKNEKIEIRCLNSEKQLKIEGEEMRHCVGHFHIIPCMKSNSHIVAIKTPNGRSTVEIQLKEKKDDNNKSKLVFNILQNFSVGNSIPSDLNTGYLDEILVPKINKISEEYKKEMMKRCQITKKYFNKTIDYKDKRKGEQIFEILKKYFAPEYRNLSFQEVETIFIKNIIEHKIENTGEYKDARRKKRNFLLT